MAFPIETEPIPLKADSEGVIRVGDTRISLDTVVAAFQEGATAEEIVFRYPVLKLADVYAVVGYYLRRKDDVEDYLLERYQVADQIRKENESRFDHRGIRSRLLARQAIEE